MATEQPRISVAVRDRILSRCWKNRRVSSVNAGSSILSLRSAASSGAAVEAGWNAESRMSACSSVMEGPESSSRPATSR